MKKQLFLKICAVSAISIMMWSCKKSDVAKPQSISNNTKSDIAASPLLVPNVYISGYTSVSSIAKYWINTNPYVALTTGSTNSFGNAIDVTSSGDIYVVGTYGSSEGGGVVWKNGVQVSLPVPSGAPATASTVARAVFVNGSDIYIAGYTWFTGSDQRATYWKLTGGSTTSIPGTAVGGTGSAAYGVTVTTAGDVYVAGIANVFGVSGTVVYWKNTVQTILAGGAVKGRPSIISIGNDVYIASAINNFTSPRTASIQLYKNGTAVTGITGGPTYSISSFGLATDGTNLYFEYAGADNSSASQITIWVWQNTGAPIYTINNSSSGPWGSTYNCFTASSTGDTYVAGWENFIASYWKNGTKTNLSGGLNNLVSGIVVK